MNRAVCKIDGFETMAKILLVEDEVDLANLVANWLNANGHQTAVLHSGDEAALEIRQYKNVYDLLIFDLKLPGTSGLDLCKFYRQKAGQAPILVITAQDSLDVMEAVFKLGADDYIAKPFHLKELQVRTEGLLRRGHLATEAALNVKDITVDPVKKQVKKDGKVVKLSPKEYSMLELFMKHPDQIFSPDEILRRVWELDTESMHDTVRGHINRLRRKLDSKGEESLISNVYSLGYKLNR